MNELLFALYGQQKFPCIFCLLENKLTIWSAGRVRLFLDQNSNNHQVQV